MLIVLLKKYEDSHDRFIKINGELIKDILNIKLSNFVKTDSSVIVIRLVSEEESQEIKDFKQNLKLISEVEDRKLIYISIASFLQSIDDLKEIIYQQFLPNKLRNQEFLSSFESIHIFNCSRISK